MIRDIPADIPAEIAHLFTGKRVRVLYLGDMPLIGILTRNAEDMALDDDENVFFTLTTQSGKEYLVSHQEIVYPFSPFLNLVE